MALELAQQDDTDRHLITVSGDVDLYSSPKLRDALLKEVARNKKPVALDLRGVQYMDSSGVATLVEALKAVGQGSGRFYLLSPAPSVLKVLQLSRLDSVFDIRDSH